jgi:AcrR family transcriptional regulator
MSVNSHPGTRGEPRKRPVQERSRRTVESILDAAARIFGERGYLATTTNDVAAAAGVSIGSLYQYFPNKDALLVALEERHLEDVRAVLAAASRQWRRDRPDPEAWARSFVDVLIDVNDTALHVLIYDTAPPLPRLREATGSLVDALAREVAFHLRRWGDRGPVELRARVIVVAALRLVHDLAVRTAPGRDRARTRDEITHLLAATTSRPRRSRPPGRSTRPGAAGSR